MNFILISSLFLAAVTGMLPAVIQLLVIVLVGLIVWYIVGLFIPDARIMSIVGLIIGLVILLYALTLFNVIG